MKLFNLPDLLAAMQPGARLLGLDPGAKRIGVALSDVTRSVASPYGVLTRAKLKVNAAEIAAIAAQEGASGLVIGLPLDEMGRSAQAARDWAFAIAAATGLPAALQDESFTTADAHATMIEMALGRAKRDRIVDKLAAANILQAALDGYKKTAGDKPAAAFF